MKNELVLIMKIKKNNECSVVFPINFFAEKSNKFPAIFTKQI